MHDLRSVQHLDLLLANGERTSELPRNALTTCMLDNQKYCLQPDGACRTRTTLHALRNVTYTLPATDAMHAPPHLQKCCPVHPPNTCTTPCNARACKQPTHMPRAARRSRAK